jgi:hypothetical protein
MELQEALQLCLANSTETESNIARQTGIRVDLGDLAVLPQHLCTLVRYVEQLDIRQLTPSVLFQSVKRIRCDELHGLGLILCGTTGAALNAHTAILDVNGSDC